MLLCFIIFEEERFRVSVFFILHFSFFTPRFFTPHSSLFASS
ncbi:hypothetical protein HMPREF1870_01084 [Bacteroidales bacterium KA00344]|nr:hypothetical protein HMPREF1870_01084 [Bacteroidales bacterium KA00344]